MKIGWLWVLLVALPLANAEERCRAKLLAAQNKRLSDIDIVLDLEADRDHQIAAFYNYRDIKSTDRPFAPREEIRYFMRSSEGSEWLDKGQQLLADMTAHKKSRSQLSESDRRLADGTLLFLRFEYLFEKADLLDEKNRIERMEIELEIAIIESVIDEKRAEVGQWPLEDRIYTDDHIKKLSNDIDQSRQMVERSQVRIKEIQGLFEELGRVGIYHKPFTDLEITLHPNVFWQGLGYSQRPY